MFNRKPSNSAVSPPTLGNGAPPPVPSPRPVQARQAGGAPSVIGSDVSIAGNLESSGEVQIEGELQGDVHAARIVVGHQANVAGELIADAVIVGGNVQGSIRGNNVTFQSASHIEGDVFHKTLAIEQGAYFEGKSRRSADPMSVPSSTNGTPSR